jgi:hypothetical protein
MLTQLRTRFLCGGLLIVCAGALPAHADLSIAKEHSRNVSCSGGSCVATAADAVMNVSELQKLLAKKSAVSLNAGVANNITVDAALTWTNSASLALTASGSLTVNKPVTVAGHSSLAIQTADSELSFAPKASISF